MSRNSAYGPEGQYKGEPDTTSPSNKSVLTGSVFAGKDASRALACSSLKPEECKPEWYDLDEKDKQVLEEWFTFFSKRYNIVGKVKDAKNF